MGRGAQTSCWTLARLDVEAMPDQAVTAQELWVCDLGSVPYTHAVGHQERIRTFRQAGDVPDVLLLLEHPPVYTLGRRAQAGELPMREDFYRGRGIDIQRCDRGGRITYHGPGQLVAYPILAVTDVVEYVRALERGVLDALALEGVRARTRTEEGPDFTGVWVRERKIASIGVHVQRGVTTHGLAVNVTNALEPFSWIVACGLPGVQMTSLAQERADLDPDVGPRFRAELTACLCAALARTPRWVPAEALGIPGAQASAVAA